MKSRILVTVLVLLWGCVPTRHLLYRQPELSARHIIDAVNAYSGAIATLNAQGSVSVETPSFVNSGSFELWMKKPDSLRVDVEGPFGIRVASALLAQRHYVFYNSFRNEVTEGNVDEAEMPPFMSISLRPEEVMGTFSGMRAFEPDETSPDSFVMDDAAFILQFRHGAVATRYTIDGETLCLMKVEHIDSSGSVWSEERYEYGRGSEGRILPGSVRLTHEKLQTSVSLMFETVHVNQPIDGMALTVPPDARRVTRR